ncbi:hypothetical protein BGP78_15105 [Pseudoalteromonas sp. MSK9-3]|uniref:hypothetical protein n=1 Tax=Pseudoalteromonas sp. MSK9-3 TaxID=1897633 RepID=UPI000E6D019B|nr:hypothetical protein [Pseudoalteromonas sp. MSK9-3]RJE76039.1 hypothetical protein BGP78_15105 [Pseudoalteromonas sp. MSK9-3]
MKALRLVVPLLFLVTIGKSWAFDPLATLKLEINEQIQAKNSRFLNYEITNSEAKFPEVPNQFICTFDNGNNIYEIISENNKIIENITDKQLQREMINELRSFEQKMMHIAAWDLFLAANNNVKARKQSFPSSLTSDSAYIPKWGAWLHDTETSANLIDNETLELNSKSLDTGKWQCEGDCLQTTLNLDIFLPSQGIKGGGELIDQMGNPVFYESRANGLLFKQLGEGYEANLPMFFPLGQCTTNIDIGITFTKDPGKRQNILPVVTTKLAWRVLTDEDDQNQFFKMENVSINLKGHKTTVNLGLVAMHVAIKEQRQRSWRWVTFEHVNNLYEPEQGSSDKPFFNNPACKDCCNNLLPKKSSTPAQITRLHPIPEGIQTLNKQLQSILKNNNSVFQYYKLVETQYTSLVAPNTDFLKTTPMDARNSVIEPFLLPKIQSCQNKTSYVTPANFFDSGCMGCHKFAKFKTKNGKPANADFTFITPLHIEKEKNNEQ